MNIFKAQEVVEMFSDPLQIILILALSTIHGLIIAATYNKTYKGYSYSQNFSITLICLTVITTFIILIIGDNIARAVGIFGAFSIVRFRTAVKDSRDTLFVFYSLATGLAFGTGSFSIGITGTLFISMLIFILSYIDFGKTRKLDYVLSFLIETEEESEKLFNQIFSKHLKKYVLLNVDSREKGLALAFQFNIKLKKDDFLKQFLDDLGAVKGLSQVKIASSKNDLEY